MNEKMTNNRLFGVLSMENLGSLVLIAFVFGMGYSALASESESTTKKVSAMETEQKQLISDVQMIQTDVAVIKNDQKHITQQLKEQKADLKLVLRLLQNGHRSP